VLAGILVAWQMTRPRITVEPLQPTINKTFAQVTDELHGRTPSSDAQRPNGGVPPYNANESIFQHGRGGARKSLLAEFDKAWSEFCRPEGHKQLVDALNYYFTMRFQHEKSYPARWGDVGRDYITREWSTVDDRRIERLTQDFYRRGFFAPSELQRSAAERIAPLVKGERVAGSCGA
jgi:hypothetical protein